MSADRSSDDVQYAEVRRVRALGLPAPKSSTDYEAVARVQAAEMESQRAVNVALMRERDQALADREAALDLAAQYARQAGIATDQDEILRYTVQYWEQRGQFEQQFNKLEGQRWEVLTVARDLDRLAKGRRVTPLDTIGLAQLIAKVLTEVATAQQPKRAVEMFARPAAPGVAS